MRRLDSASGQVFAPETVTVLPLLVTISPQMLRARSGCSHQLPEYDGKVVLLSVKVVV